MEDKYVLLTYIIVFVAGYICGYFARANENHDPKNDNNEDLDYHI
jgi:hypothetical protein